MPFFHWSSALPFVALIGAALALPGCSTTPKRPPTPEQELAASRPIPYFSELGMGRERVFGAQPAAPGWTLASDGSVKLASPLDAMPETEKLFGPAQPPGSIHLAPESPSGHGKAAASSKAKKKRAASGKQAAAGKSAPSEKAPSPGKSAAPEVAATKPAATTTGPEQATAPMPTAAAPAPAPVSAPVPAPAPTAAPSAPKIIPAQAKPAHKAKSSEPTPWLDKDFQWAPGAQDKRGHPAAGSSEPALEPKDAPH